MGKQTKYKREVLLKDKRFQCYQQDFLAVVLNKDEYTLTEAEKVVREFFERK